MNKITILSPVKRDVWTGKTFDKSTGTLKDLGYGGAKHFTSVEQVYSDFNSFCHILETLQHNGRSIVIHGEKINELPNGWVNRRKLLGDDNEPACFRENPDGTSWCMIDIDNFVNPFGKPSDVEAQRALSYYIVCETLPPEFQRASYWYQWSNSMLVKNDWNTLKIHLWFMFKTPQTDTMLGQWADDNGKIDDCVFRTVQPNYIAKPKFIGMSDIFGVNRSGRVTEFGETDYVDFQYQYVSDPVFKMKSAKLVAMQQRIWAEEGKKFRYIDPIKSSSAFAKLAEIGVGGRLHYPIIKSAGSWITSCGENPDKEMWKQEVRERVVVSGHSEIQHRSSDAYLNECWNSAARKYKSKNPKLPPMPRELLPNTNSF